MDKPFFLENDNVDASQRNVVFLVRGEKAKTVMKVAGTYIAPRPGLIGCVLYSITFLGWEHLSATRTLNLLSLYSLNLIPYRMLN